MVVCVCSNVFHPNIFLAQNNKSGLFTLHLHTIIPVFSMDKPTFELAISRKICPLALLANNIIIYLKINYVAKLEFLQIKSPLTETNFLDSIIFHCMSLLMHIHYFIFILRIASKQKNV